ncbi:MAG TPA: peptide deformylase [Candidatus Paceibacterota bacterium]|jgi:peptide deformylase|nr:peptide deformylase [Candidatus Paceibacterota bacterium]
MLKKILQKDQKVLREHAKEVPVREITTPKIKKILKEMSLALASQSDGVAIAAPQIGYSLRIFVVSGKIFREDFARERSERMGGGPAEAGAESTPEDLIFINPKVTKLSRDKEWLPEGCLSVRWLYGKALRSKKATVAAYDQHGKKFTRGASGLLAQIFQHETDHLDGVLFIDHAKDIREEKPAK